MLEPRRWQLEVAGHRRSEHARASDALARARQVERLWRRARSVRRSLVAVGVSLAILFMALPFRMLANDDYRPVRAFVDRMERIYDSVRSGQITPQAVESESNGEFTAAEFTVTSPITLGGDAVTRHYEMLVGDFGDECFVIHWTANHGSFYGVLHPDRSCVPAEALTQSGLYSRSRSGTPESALKWETILPPPEIQATWFVPLVWLVCIVVLGALVGASLAFLRPVLPEALLPDLPAGLRLPVVGGVSPARP